ncbi:MAG: hypothetical protein M1837_000535 [Sclerophora amabilis]|nr:MAG: hypothetical protein M1837_000535 [Sclerophora amabilis]
MNGREYFSIDASPFDFDLPKEQTALLVVDMQRDLLPKNYNYSGTGSKRDAEQALPYVRRLLHLFRGFGMQVFYTRKGQPADHPEHTTSKLLGNARHGTASHQLSIGQRGNTGMAPVRGGYGNEIVEGIKPLPGEVVIDKTGRSAFTNTNLMEKLSVRNVTHLVVVGVTIECGFDMTTWEANDRGFECCTVVDATASYDAFKKPTPMDTFDGGLYGFVTGVGSFAEMEYLLSASRLPKMVQASHEHVLVASPGSPPTPEWDGDLSVRSLATKYRHGLSVVTVVEKMFDRIERYRETDDAVFICVRSRKELIRAAKEVESRYPHREALPPLFGIPFSVEDSINVAGMPTTTGCPSLASTASESAALYEKIVHQGAIFIGKTNLDQLGTGMTGCRSPYGTPKSVFHKDFIAGGSSSGSAVSVGADLVSFSLCSDTAGSVRIPAAFNGIVGLKPTRGTLSARGLTPACPSLDSMALLARSVDDVRKVWWYCEGYDEDDIHAKLMSTSQRASKFAGPRAKDFRFGIPPPQVLAKCCPIYRKKFEEAITIFKSIGGNADSVDWSPFEKGGELLYEGTFVSERIAALPDGWLEQNREHLHPVTRDVFESVQARNSTAVEAYRDLMAQALYTRQMNKMFSATPGGIDVLVVPSTPIQWTVDEVKADPMGSNSQLGAFSHFANVLDMAAIAVPTGTYEISELGSRVPSQKMNTSASSPSKLPFGVTLLGPGGTDANLLKIAGRFERAISESAKGLQPKSIAKDTKRKREE